MRDSQWLRVFVGEVTAWILQCRSNQQQSFLRNQKLEVYKPFAIFLYDSHFFGVLELEHAVCLFHLYKSPVGILQFDEAGTDVNEKRRRPALHAC